MSSEHGKVDMISRGGDSSSTEKDGPSARYWYHQPHSGQADTPSESLRPIPRTLSHNIRNRLRTLCVQHWRSFHGLLQEPGSPQAGRYLVGDMSTTTRSCDLSYHIRNRIGTPYTYHHGFLIMNPMPIHQHGSYTGEEPPHQQQRLSPRTAHEHPRSAYETKPRAHVA